MVRIIGLLAFFAIFGSPAFAQSVSSGDGQSDKELDDRSWWDVLYYNVTVRPDIKTKTLTGVSEIQYKEAMARHADQMQIDLQEPLAIDSVVFEAQRVQFKKSGAGKWMLTVPNVSKRPYCNISIYYSGKPSDGLPSKQSPGIIWTSDEKGRPWVAAYPHAKSGTHGASAWFPCKDGQWDKADYGSTVTVVVPSTLIGVANGRLKSTVDNSDGTTSFRWGVVSAIASTSLVFYVGNYMYVNEDYAGAKDKLDVACWVMDYNEEHVHRHMMPAVNYSLKAMEHWFGPYPFYEDGFKMVEAPYKGEGYQSTPAYGNHFDNGKMNVGKNDYIPLKFDPVIVKNVAKEWFGSSVATCGGDDAWFSNAIAGYAEELVMSDLYTRESGKEHYRLRIMSLGGDKANQGVLYRDGKDIAGGTYVKGWGVIRTLRGVLGDGQFKKVMWEMNKGLGHLTVSSKQIEQYISTATGTDYSHFFRTYTEGFGVPMLFYCLQGTNLKFRLAKCAPGLEMPLKVYMPELKNINATTYWQTVKIHDDLQGYLNLDEAYLLKKLYVDKID